MSEEIDSELLEKIVLKNKLNEETIAKLIKSILSFTHSICTNSKYSDYIVPLKIMADDFENLKIHYDKVLDSIINE